jgi:hypothetical protein
MQSTENGNGDHAAGPLDGPPQWRILSQSQVRSRLIVIVRIDGKNPSQVRLAKDNDFIEAFAAECANQTRGMTILPWRARRDWPVADAHRPDPGGEDAPVADHYRGSGNLATSPTETLGNLLR